RKQHSDAELEALEHELSRPEDADQDAPEVRQVHGNVTATVGTSSRRAGFSPGSTRAYRRISTKSTTAKIPYSEANIARLTPSISVLTFGELACDVLSNPNTIHGWRPTSVSTQPARAATYGNAIDTTPSRRNQRLRSSDP